MRTINVKVHPAANIFPWMDDEAFNRLKEDIRTRGQAEEVLFYDGMLLDGRNRWAACQELGIDCADCEIDQETVTDPYAYVLSLNLHRRHLTESQRAMVAARMATLKRGRPTEEKGPIGPITIEDASKALSVGRNSVKRAKNVIDKGCKAVVDAVDQNKVPVSLASKLVDEVDNKKEQARLVREGKKAIRDYLAQRDQRPVKHHAHAGHSGVVRIDSGPVSATDKFRDTPQDRWHFLVMKKRSFLSTNIDYDCRCLVEFVDEAQIAWEFLGYESAEDMIRNGYELEPQEIELAVAWLRINNPEQAFEEGIANTLSKNEKAIQVLRAADSKLSVLKAIIDHLEPHELDVVHGWTDKKSPAAATDRGGRNTNEF